LEPIELRPPLSRRFAQLRLNAIEKGVDFDMDVDSDLPGDGRLGSNPAGADNLGRQCLKFTLAVAGSSAHAAPGRHLSV